MSHTSFLYHFVWRTKYSLPAIDEKHERDFYSYVMGICNNKNCHLIRINSMPDHVHMLVSVLPELSISEFMKVMKGETSKWMKQHRDWFPIFPGWGSGYGGFSYSIKEKNIIFNYIKNQKQHHAKKDFKTEFTDFLIENGMDPETDKFFDDDDE